MRVRLSPTSSVPIYRQIVEQLIYQIAGGTLKNGDRLPSVRELARSLPANQNTIIKAYEMLERDGLITRRHGNGTFVSSAGTPVRPRERKRIVGEVLAQAAAKAVLLGMSAADVHALLDEQLDLLSVESGKPNA